MRNVERAVRLEEPQAERWLRQTKRGGGHVPPEERGDCVPACISSILGLPIDAIPNCHGEGWWDKLQEAVKPFGYGLQLMAIEWDPADIYWIASVPSLNLPPEPDGGQAYHCIVVKGREFVHDPALDDRYDADRWAKAWNEKKVPEGWALVPLDPADPRPFGREDAQLAASGEGTEPLKERQATDG